MPGRRSSGAADEGGTVRSRASGGNGIGGAAPIKLASIALLLRMAKDDAGGPMVGELPGSPPAHWRGTSPSSLCGGAESGGSAWGTRSPRDWTSRACCCGCC